MAAPARRGRAREQVFVALVLSRAPAVVGSDNLSGPSRAHSLQGNSVWKAMFWIG